MFKTYIWVKNLPAMQETQETQVQSLGQEDPLEEMVTHSSILAWKIPRTEEHGGCGPWGRKRVGRDLATKRPLPGDIVETRWVKFWIFKN